MVNLDLLELDDQVFAKCFIFIGFHKSTVCIESVKWDVERISQRDIPDGFEIGDALVGTDLVLTMLEHGNELGD